MPDETPNALDAVLQHVTRFQDVAVYRSPYETADEPRDTLMAAQLHSTFKQAGIHEVGHPGVGLVDLSGIPIEDVARQVNLQWLALVTEQIQVARTVTKPWPYGTDADWAIVCPSHMFEHWATIDGVEVLRNPALPPFTVYLIRSTQWWARTYNKPDATWLPNLLDPEFPRPLSIVPNDLSKEPPS